ncbi:MAG TPA: glutamate-cysteine ligase family protein [Cyclobacteriaceae bacterium]|nr:glutamate-cysteine ligase family protein [Cyclobacteriaceae bacterium]
MTLHLFEAFGIELEYMIVDRDTLEVQPIADELLKSMTGSYSGDFENGMVTWSNELVLHLIELKCTKPESDLAALEQSFHQNIKQVNQILSKWNAMLLPTAAHPTMDPLLHTKLWPHDKNEIYSIYNKIFDCRGHGWANLQSTHLNLPFNGDEEFGKLHSAIRVILPLLPALCASSTVLDGKLTEQLDARMWYYKHNQKAIPSITGSIVPEAVFTKEEYEQEIYSKIAIDIQPHNENDILDPVWVNSRGAMARFDRGSVEIRVMDIQECPAADMAIQRFVISALKKLVTVDRKNITTEALATKLDEVVYNGMDTMVTDRDWLAVFNMKKPSSVREILGSLSDNNPVIQTILQQGNLSTRIRKSLNGDLSKKSIHHTWQSLSKCLENNKMFTP